MGCWNGTCNISNMPIFAGDKVVLIPLMKVHDEIVVNACYPTDNFIPLGFPIIGYYNDYGGIYDVEISDENRDYFKSLDFYFYNRDEDADEKYVKVQDYENFEDFVNNVLCTVEGCFLNADKMDLITNDLLKDGKSEINFMMVHYDLYFALIENMGNRKPFGKEDVFKNLLTNNFNFILNENLERIEQAKKISEETNNTEIISIFKKIVYREMTDRIFNPMDKFYELRWNYFVNILLDNPDKRDEIINRAVDKYIFTTVLSRLRKGYICDSGCGSQSEETKLHLIMADFIRNQVVKNAKRFRKSEDGVEEYIFY